MYSPPEYVYSPPEYVCTHHQSTCVLTVGVCVAMCRRSVAVAAHLVRVEFVLRDAERCRQRVGGATGQRVRGEDGGDGRRHRLVVFVAHRDVRLVGEADAVGERRSVLARQRRRRCHTGVLQLGRGHTSPVSVCTTIVCTWPEHSGATTRRPCDGSLNRRYVS